MCVAYVLLRRLDPRFWCFTKKQLIALRDEVDAYWKAKHIKNLCQDQFPYPQEMFDDPNLGPNLYQVIVHACRHRTLCTHEKSCMVQLSRPRMYA